MSGGVEIGFAERFALAEDRNAALSELVTGTDDYFYYRLTHLMNTWEVGKDFKEIDRVFTDYRNAFPYGEHTERMQELKLRRNLLGYASGDKAQVEKALEHLRDKYGLTFNEEREIVHAEDEPPVYPDTLDPATVDVAKIMKETLKREASGVYEFDEAALDYLLTTADLSKQQRRQLLTRISRPDHGSVLVKHIAKDMDWSDNGYATSFGTSVHRSLTLQQFQDLLSSRSALINDMGFFEAVLTRLVPTDDVNVETDPKEMLAYIDRLLAFVTPRAGPQLASLRATLLYRRLDLDLQMGTIDEGRLVSYLEIPKSFGVCSYAYREKKRDKPMAYQQHFGIPHVGSISDEGRVVGEYLARIFADPSRDLYRPFDTYLEDSYVKTVFAQSRLMAGVGKQEQLTAMLAQQGALEALRSEVVVAFAPENKRYYGASDPVRILVDVKNVASLTVKVFELNMQAYYRENKAKDVDTAVNLDGLMATAEQVIACTEPPIRKVRRSIELPQCGSAGVYVVEVIGGGKSSRAILRKGSLHFAERTGAAGHVITVMGEDGTPVGAGCTVTLLDSGSSATNFTTDSDGVVVIPFTCHPGKRSIVLTHGRISTLGHFDHVCEDYELRARFAVDRGSLVAGNPRVDVIVTPTLLLCGHVVTTRVLEDAVVTVCTRDLDGVTSTRRFPVTLSDTEETAISFAMPERIAGVRFELTASVKKMDGTKANFSVSDSEVSVASSSTEVSDAFFRFRDGKYEICFFGRTGEARAKCVCTVSLKLRQLTNAVTAVLQSDAEGLVKLGPLDNVTHVNVSWGNRSASFDVPRNECRYPSQVHVAEGSEVVVPVFTEYLPEGSVPVSVIETRNGQFVADVSSKVSVGNNNLARIAGLEPGTYSVRVKAAFNPADFTIIVAGRGAKALGGRYIVSPTRVLETRDANPLQVVAVDTQQGGLRVRLANFSPSTRVHVVLPHFVPSERSADGIFGKDCGTYGPVTLTFPPPTSDYVAARVLGDEEKYVLERRQRGAKRVGNMLTRPSLLLKPWSIGDAKTTVQTAAAGGGFDRVSREAMARRNMRFEAASYRSGGNFGGQAPTQDFLDRPTAVAANLRPNAEGWVEVPAATLSSAACALARIVAVDGKSLVQRLVPIPGGSVARPFRDLRQLRSLDGARHYMEQKEATVLMPGDELVVHDPKSSKIEIYDTAAKVFRLFQALHANSALSEFDFLLRWDGLSPSEKRRLYAANACHEVNFFLYRRDRAFFDASVLPLLKSKLEKTFMDRYLLGESLAAYDSPAMLARMNVFERALLASRLTDPSARQGVAASVADRSRSARVSPREESRLFGIALGGTALDGEANDGASLPRGGDDSDLDESGESEGGFDASTASFAPKGYAMAKSIAPPSDGPPRPMPMPMMAMAMAPPPPPPGGMPAPSMGAPMMPPPPPMADVAEEESVAFGASLAGEDLIVADGDADMRHRENAQQQPALYRQTEKTKELAETNYHKSRAWADTSSLVKANAFWADFARHMHERGEDVPFLTRNLHLVGAGTTECLLALGALGLPLQLDAGAQGPVSIQRERARLTLRANGGAAVVYSRQTREIAADGAAGKHRIMVYETTTLETDGNSSDGEGASEAAAQAEAGTQDNPVLPYRVYRTRVVLSNMSPKSQLVDALVQVPEGSIPVGDSRYTSSQPREIASFSVVTLDYLWYMPSAGSYAHYPAQVTCSGALVGYGEPRTVVVSTRAGTAAAASWDIVSQSGTLEQVLAMVKEASRPADVPLSRIAWRAKQQPAYAAIVALLRQRRWYSADIWKFALRHNDTQGIAEWFGTQSVPAAFPATPPLLPNGPAARGQYEHLEYSPLINARAHMLSQTRKIPNATMAAQYNRFLARVCGLRSLSHEDRLEAAHYLLLQDRVDDARAVAAPVFVAGETACSMQRDYLSAYLEFYSPTPDLARAATIVDRYTGAVGRWGDLFAEVRRQAAEILGAASGSNAQPAVADREEGAKGPAERSLQFEVVSGVITVTCRGLSGRQGEARFYAMDTELLFSSNPFVQQNTGRFLYVRPNKVVAFSAPADAADVRIPVPAEFSTRNAIVEVCVDDVRRTAPVYSSGLSVQISEGAGTLRVTSSADRRPAAGVYVKVYAEKTGSSSAEFYKDGYTDLRGCFDYVSLSTDDLDNTRRFALFVASDSLGSVVRECAPPTR